MLYVGRLFAGFGVGVLVMIVPQFQAEIAHPSIRGTVTALQQFFLGIGALVSNWVVTDAIRDGKTQAMKPMATSISASNCPGIVPCRPHLRFPRKPAMAH